MRRRYNDGSTRQYGQKCYFARRVVLLQAGERKRERKNQFEINIIFIREKLHGRNPYLIIEACQEMKKINKNKVIIINRKPSSDMRKIYWRKPPLPVSKLKTRHDQQTVCIRDVTVDYYLVVNQRSWSKCNFFFSFFFFAPSNNLFPTKNIPSVTLFNTTYFSFISSTTVAIMNAK